MTDKTLKRNVLTLGAVIFLFALLQMLTPSIKELIYGPYVTPKEDIKTTEQASPTITNTKVEAETPKSQKTKYLTQEEMLAILIENTSVPNTAGSDNKDRISLSITPQTITFSLKSSDNKVNNSTLKVSQDGKELVVSSDNFSSIGLPQEIAEGFRASMKSDFNKLLQNYVQSNEIAKLTLKTGYIEIVYY